MCHFELKKCLIVETDDVYKVMFAKTMRFHFIDYFHHFKEVYGIAPPLITW